MAPLPLAAAAEESAEILEVRCLGCGETLEVEPGLTEFVCPDCATPQSLPPELMPPPPPRRRALPLPRGAADARGPRLPCGACGGLLSVPVGLSRCACPLCGAELAVDSARLRNYILSSAAPDVVPLATASVPPIVGAREAWQWRHNFATRRGLPRAEPDDKLIPLKRTRIERPDHLIHVQQDGQEYPDHMSDGEKIHVVNETVASNSLQRNQFSLGRGIASMEKRQVSPLNAARHQVNGQHSSYNIQAKRAQLARLHRVIHSEEMQEGPSSHEFYREARHTELIYETAATHSNQRVGCSVGPKTTGVEQRHIETPNQIIQQLQKQPYHEIHVEHTQVGCLDGVIHAQEVQPEPVNQANHGKEVCIQMINKTIARDNNRPVVCSVGPNTVSAEKRKALTTNQVTQQTQKQQSDVTRAEHTQIEHTDQVIHEPHGEAVRSLPIKETTARCSKRKVSHLVNAKTVVKKSHIEPLNNIIQQPEGQTPDIDNHAIQVEFERQSKGIGRHQKHKTGNDIYSNLTFKEQEQIVPPNLFTHVKQKHVLPKNEIQKEQTEVKVCKQTSSRTQKKNGKGSMASSNAGLQLRRSKRLAKGSVAVVENKPVESDPVQLQVSSPNGHVPTVDLDSETIEWEPFKQRSASQNCEVSAAMTDMESVESEHHEQYAVSPVQSMSESDPPDIDRIIADLCPSTSSVHEMPQEISNEPDDLHLTTTPSNPDMSDPERFARHYCLLFPLEVRRALAKKKSNSLLDRLMSEEGSDEASLHDLTDSEEQQQGIKRKKVQGRGPTLCVKVWTLPEGARVPVSLNYSGLPIGKNAAMLSNFLGTLARDGILAPLTYESWKSIPKENKNVMWHIVKLKFDVGPPCELSVLKCIRKKWRGWRSNLKIKHYDSHITEEERLADRDPRVLKEQWPLLVAYWNTEKAKVASAKCKASRAKSTYINTTGSKSFARILEEESRSHDPAHKNSEGSGNNDASAMGAERRHSTRNYEHKAALKSPLREAVESKRMAEDEAATLRKKVMVMEESQKKLQEDLARMNDTVSAMQKMMSIGSLSDGLKGQPTVPPSFQQPYIDDYSALYDPSSSSQQTQV